MWYSLLQCFLFVSISPLRIDPLALVPGRSKAVDFIDKAAAIHSLNEEKNRSHPIYKEALMLCQQNYRCTGQDLAVLSPSYSSCAWLQISHMDHSGLGHTLATWAFYMHAAWKNRLTFYSPFYSASHDTGAYLNASAYLFGLHSVFYWARQPPNNTSTLYIPIGIHFDSCSLTNCTLYENVWLFFNTCVVLIKYFMLFYTVVQRITLGAMKGNCSPQLIAQAVNTYKSTKEKGLDRSEGEFFFLFLSF